MHAFSASSGKAIDPQNFADKFKMHLDEAVTLMSYIKVGSNFKEKHLDGNAEALKKMKGGGGSGK